MLLCLPTGGGGEGGGWLPHPVLSRGGCPDQGPDLDRGGTPGYPPCPDLGWGTPPSWPRNGVTPPPPPASVDRLKILPSLILQTQAVINRHHTLFGIHRLNITGLTGPSWEVRRLNPPHKKSNPLPPGSLRTNCTSTLRSSTLTHPDTNWIQMKLHTESPQLHSTFERPLVLYDSVLNVSLVKPHSTFKSYCIWMSPHLVTYCWMLERFRADVQCLYRRYDQYFYFFVPTLSVPRTYVTFSVWMYFSLTMASRSPPSMLFLFTVKSDMYVIQCEPFWILRFTPQRKSGSDVFISTMLGNCFSALTLHSNSTSALITALLTCSAASFVHFCLTYSNFSEFLVGYKSHRCYTSSPSKSILDFFRKNLLVTSQNPFTDVDVMNQLSPVLVVAMFHWFHGWLLRCFTDSMVGCWDVSLIPWLVVEMFHWFLYWLLRCLAVKVLAVMNQLIVVLVVAMSHWFHGWLLQCFTDSCVGCCDVWQWSC